MKITYDRQSDSMYLKLRDTDVMSTEPIGADGNLNANIDADGNIVGIEFVFVQDILDWIDREEDGLEIPDHFPIAAAQSR